MTRISVPDRLAAEIDRQDAEAEIRISWMQLALVSVFGVLYSLVPRAEGTEGFNFVPYALTGYAVFTFLRLVLAYRDWLRPSILVLSAIVDIALICGLIFSFHIQYVEPAAFYLKAPTMLYLFLFVALRALRFDPLYVAITGIAGAVGWLALLAYAVFLDPAYPGRTRDFPMYVNGDMVLYGAELDKVLVILGVTGLIAYALVRARRVLVAAVRDHAAVSNFSRFFSPDVATIVGSEDPNHLRAGYVVDRDIAVVMVDLRNFSGLAQQLTPEETVSILTRFHAHVVPEIRAAGGAIDKFMGDGILATFGAVRPSDTPAADALRAIARILAAIDVCNARFADDLLDIRLRAGCAAAYGRVVVGIVGDESHLEYTVIGRSVNRAAKLEVYNKVAGSRALTDQLTWEAALAQGLAVDGPPEPLRDVTVPGLEGEQDLVILAR